VSGNRVTFIGDAMAAVVQGVGEARTLIGQPPVVVGGLAVMCRLSSPYRATTDLDVVDRLLGEVPQLQVLRAVWGAEPVEPAAVLPLNGAHVEVSTLVAEPGPIVAMKLQAISPETCRPSWRVHGRGRKRTRNQPRAVRVAGSGLVRRVRAGIRRPPLILGSWCGR
jgi:hypothetical protein